MQAVNGVAIVAATPYTSKVVLIKVNGTTFAAFYAFLSFLYTDNVCFEDHLALAVMELAARYKIKRLYEHCGRRCLMVQKACEQKFFLG